MHQTTLELTETNTDVVFEFDSEDNHSFEHRSRFTSVSGRTFGQKPRIQTVQKYLITNMKLLELYNGQKRPKRFDLCLRVGD